MIRRATFDDIPQLAELLIEGTPVWEKKRVKKL